MTLPITEGGVGSLLRKWRRRRKISQHELALQVETSARHLSFVETGRSRPSRSLLHRLADGLEIPLRQRNTLLVSAGYSPLYQETPLEAPRLKVVREAVDRLITAHAPYPALAVDADEDIVAMNLGAELLLAEVSPALLVPPVNVMRVCLHPEGLARQVVNVDEWRSHLLGRLYRQSVYSGRESLRELYDEVTAYGPRTAKDCQELSDTIVASIRVRALGTELKLFSTITTFGAATDITVAELSLETMHPADAHTAAAFRAAAERQPDRKASMSLLSRSA
ncbi:helix-turn-helix transcriptional regulator [Streptomyces sp. NBC_00190]|uniref:helix-turn-helix domain-containing protein n=1 Tax=Streptomyces sp. NBC_00190 TaxID=2903634 RepID=UPI002E2AD14E|nr:helix-turn-helix transcriptional regulator [Streptomyces sp. NBC_00190]